MVDFKSFRQSLTIEQVEEVVVSLGSAPPQRDSFAFCFQTICHNEPSQENSYKLYYYPSSALFNCFTECSDTYDIVDLVVKAKYVQDGDIITKFQALEYIENLLDIEAPTEEVEKKETTSEILAYLARVENAMSLEEKPLPTLKEEVLESFPKLPPLDWMDEGISLASIQKYEIGYDPISISITIPVRNKDGELVGIRCRRLEQPSWEKYGRYGPLITNDKSYSYPTSFNLYGLSQNLSSIKESQLAIIAEGEKSVLLGDTFFGNKNVVVATQGSNISLRQIRLLKGAGVKEVVIAFDRQFVEVGDEEYCGFLKKMLKLSRKLSDHFEKVSYICDEEKLTEYKDAPFDKGVETFKKLYLERKEFKQ